MHDACQLKMQGMKTHHRSDFFSPAKEHTKCGFVSSAQLRLNGQRREKKPAIACWTANATANNLAISMSFIQHISQCMVFLTDLGAFLLIL